MQPKTRRRSSQAGGVELKRCWNCRRQKIACDKTRPSCQNCLRKGQVCLGYGLKLSWPQDNDKRRSASRNEHYMLPVQVKDLDFINISVEDIEAFRNHGVIRYNQQSPRPLLQQPQNSLGTLDPFLATNRYSPVARLVASSYDADDLYSLLVRLSLGEDSLPSLASRYAISALSYQHLRMNETAAMYQIGAIQALQSAIENLHPSQAMQAMAASMLLSIFETLNFDSSDLSWSIFFCGTKRIANHVTQKDDTYYGDEALIMDWIFYHDVMYKFSIRHWENKNDDQIALAGQQKVISKAVFSPERQVVPIIGCSLELLDLLCQVIDVVVDRDEPGYQSESHVKALRSLEIRLQRLAQRHSGVSKENTHDMIHEEKVAELFRLATQIYLYSVAKGSELGNCDTLKEAITKAFDILSQLQYCERPWILFIIGIEAATDDQREIILALLKKSLQRRPLGTLALTNRMIHDAWIQQDLHEDRLDRLLLYGLMVSRNRVPPNFT